MTRLFTAALLVLSLALPFSAAAEPNLDKAPEGAVVQAAVDAVPVPVAQPRKTQVEKSSRMTPRGSSQSAAGFRFTSPYAYPQQTLPFVFPSLAPISF